MINLNCSHSDNCLPDWNSSFNYSNCSWCRNGSRTGTRNWCPGFEGCRCNFHVMGYYTASRGPLVNFLLFLFSRSISITIQRQNKIKKLLFFKFSNGLRSVAGLGKFQKHQLIVLLLLNTQNEKVCWDLLFLPACCSSPSFPGLKS